MADGKVTIAWWCRHDTLSTDYQTYFTFYTNSGNRCYINRRSAGTIYTYMVVNGASSAITTSSVAISDMDWNHMAFVIDGASFSLYVDGVLIQTMTARSLAGWVGDPRVIMGTRDMTPNDRYLRGALDDVRVYNRLLTEEELQELMSLAQYPPSVDAGPMQSQLWPGSPVTLQMDATVTDDGKPEPPALTYSWSQLSGPAAVSFSDTAVEDPCVTFSAAGLYELQLSASDGEKDACDVVIMRFRTSNDPLAYWDFEEGSDPVNDDSANNNVGTRAGNAEPNWVDGWLLEAYTTTNKALEFYGEVDPCVVLSYVNITTDAAPDPNLDNIQHEISLSAWIKVNAVNGGWPVIIANGNNSWRMGIMSEGVNIHRIYFSGQGLAAASVYSNTKVNDGYWHHVAGSWDGNTRSIYIDGILENSQEISGQINLNDLPVTIGARATSATTVERNWNGLIDDLRVYDYGISAAQVQALAAMGKNLVPNVDAGEDQSLSIQYGALQLDGTVIDDGVPVAATLEWTSDPCNPGTVTFSPGADIEDPCATFSTAGIYVLRLTADDTMATIYDEVTITVESPTCQNIIDDGLLIMGDQSGPEGTPDCYINLYDFAVFAGNWLRCNDPQDPECEFPY